MMASSRKVALAIVTAALHAHRSTDARATQRALQRSQVASRLSARGPADVEKPQAPLNPPADNGQCYNHVWDYKTDIDVNATCTHHDTKEDIPLSIFFLETCTNPRDYDWRGCYTCSQLCTTQLETFGSRVVPCFYGDEAPTKQEVKTTTCNQWAERHKFYRDTKQADLYAYTRKHQSKSFVEGYEPKTVASHFLDRFKVDVLEEISEVPECVHFHVLHKVHKDTDKSRNTPSHIDPDTGCIDRFRGELVRRTIAGYWINEALEDGQSIFKSVCEKLCEVVFTAFHKNMRCAMHRWEARDKKVGRETTCPRVHRVGLQQALVPLHIRERVEESLLPSSILL